MNQKECIQAAVERVPVITNDGIVYRRISAVIFRYPTDAQLERGLLPYIQIECEDYSGNSYSICNPKQLKRKDDVNDQ